MFPDAGPTARVLLTLELLQSRPGITAGQLSQRLGVSERAARRCVQTLRDVGVPVDATRGPHGGYRLGRGLRLPPLVFSATEALGLVMAVLDGNHPAADPDDPVGAALGKLIDALPENVGRQAALVRAHAAPAAQHRADRPVPATTAALVEAVAQQRRVTLTYTSPRGDGPDRTWDEDVDPWAVVVRHGRWYLLCHSHRADAVRTYRVDRISDVRPHDATFDVPPDLDPVADLDRHLARGWRYPVRVVFDAPIDAVRPWIGASMGELSPHPDDPARCVLDGSTDNPPAYAGEWLAGIPYPFTVEGGPELVAAVRALVAKLGDAVR